MADTIRIQMMDHFLIYIDEKKTDHLATKSKKGAALVQYLILNEGEPGPNQKLLAVNTLLPPDPSELLFRIFRSDRSPTTAVAAPSPLSSSKI